MYFVKQHGGVRGTVFPPDYHGGGTDEVCGQRAVSEAQVRSRVHHQDQTTDNANTRRDIYEPDQTRDGEAFPQRSRQGRTLGEYFYFFCHPYTKHKQFIS